MQSNTQTSKHGLKVHKWTEDHHNARVASLGTKQINERNCCRLARSHSRGKNYSLGFHPGIQVEIGRTRLQPVRQIYVRPVISLAAVPQQQRDREIIGADTLLGACPAGAQCIAADAGSDGKEDRGSPVLIFPSNPSASTATAPPQRQRGRCCEERRWKLPPQREFSPPARSSQKLCVSRESARPGEYRWK